jgi:hypothetical protein
MSDFAEPNHFPEQETGFVKKKIRASNPKNRGVGSPARASGQLLIQKAAKKLAKLLDSIPDEYLDRALRRLGEQLDATKPMWDVAKKKMIDIPDERIRQDAAAMILAYTWGTPVARSITAHGDVDDFEAMLEKARNSPAFMESLQKTAAGKEIVLELEDSPDLPAGD